MVRVRPTLLLLKVRPEMTMKGSEAARKQARELKRRVTTIQVIGYSTTLERSVVVIAPMYPRHCSTTDIQGWAVHQNSPIVNPR
jgi:hypothetical protein